MLSAVLDGINCMLKGGLVLIWVLEMNLVPTLIHRLPHTNVIRIKILRDFWT